MLNKSENIVKDYYIKRNFKVYECNKIKNKIISKYSLPKYYMHNKLISILCKLTKKPISFYSNIDTYGIPDLFIYNFKNNIFFFIEVKTPNYNKLSKNQIIWYNNWKKYFSIKIITVSII